MACLLAKCQCDSMKEVRNRVSSIHNHRYKRLIAKLVELREGAGQSQSELASALGLMQPDISKIERLERRLDILEAIDWIRAVKGDHLPSLVEIWQISRGEDR